LKDPRAMLARYPHEVSGGEKQRAVIAGVLATEPDCILFDEPTTALDIITARQILELIRSLQAELKIGAIYISHDLALVSQLADRVAVLKKGCIVEQGMTRDVLSSPRDAYTMSLLAKIPRPSKRLCTETHTAAAAPLLRMENLTVVHGRSGSNGGTAGLRSFSLAIGHGEIVALVGESGSGKSTLARALVGLNRFSGRIVLEEKPITSARQMDVAYRKAVQMVFQHPGASLSPKRRIRDILRRPLRLFRKGESLNEDEEVAAILTEVGLPSVFAQRYAHELSGGQMQRVAVAGVFAARPKLIVCDEITSSLDISSQASIIELLLALRKRTGASILFITHDLNLARQIADRIAVLYRGDLLEVSNAASLGDDASHSYTRALLAAVPAL
jgi:peptide/nickel transport system ATP-binding protein